jgi:peptidoglycan/xylan/chitin deacetylase (PgdA/CDA1 family)
METSADGDSESAATLTKATIIFLFLLPLACYKKPFSENLQKHFSFVTKPVDKAQRVTVKKKQKKKKLYLTFDDGPNKGTKNVLTTVKDEQVPVTFFIVGQHVFASTDQQQLWDSLKMTEQIELCNHSFCHARGRYEKYYQSPDSVVGDFKRTQDSLQLDNAVARTPGRNIWRIDTLRFTDLKKSTAAADSLQNAGFVLMGWDLEWQFDHKTMSVTTTAEKMIAAIDSVFKKDKTKCKDNLVVLAHDQAYVKSNDSIELRLFLQMLKQREEYEFSLVTSYPGADKRIPDSIKIK